MKTNPEKTPPVNYFRIIDFCTMCVKALFLLFLLSMIAWLVYAFLFVPTRNSLGYTPKGDFLMYEQAMKNSNGPQALYSIEKSLKYRYGSYMDSFRKTHIGYAYEMNHQYEASLKYFDPEKAAERGRIFFKQGERPMAFQEYCIFARAQQVGWGEGEPYGIEFIDTIRNTVMCKYTFETLCPYKDYNEFIIFMENEYEKFPQKDSFTDVMKVFRAARSQKE